jgi:hypothetical protein
VASQLAFNQSEWQIKYFGETPAAERFQIWQQVRQMAYQNLFQQQELNRELK